jgi:uncharacterized membrane protein
MTMYVDNMTVLAIIMALVSTMTMTGVAVYKAHQWEQAYHDVRRKVKNRNGKQIMMTMYYMPHADVLTAIRLAV